MKDCRQICNPYDSHYYGTYHSNREAFFYCQRCAACHLIDKKGYWNPQENIWSDFWSVSWCRWCKSLRIVRQGSASAHCSLPFTLHIPLKVWSSPGIQNHLLLKRCVWNVVGIWWWSQEQVVNKARALNCIFVCHPGSTLEFVSGISIQTRIHFFGARRILHQLGYVEKVWCLNLGVHANARWWLNSQWADRESVCLCRVYNCWIPIVSNIII